MSEVVITDIKTTRKGRYALFCDEGFLFSVDEETLLRHNLAPGARLSGEELETVRQNSDYMKAKNKALDYLGVRAHSEGELYDKLRLKFDEHTAAAVVAKLRELGLTDDGAFARGYAEELFGRAGMSARAAALKLRERGITGELADEALAPYADGDADRARELVQAKYAGRLGDKKGRDAVTAALARRGFALRDIRLALEGLAEIEYGEDAPDEGEL